MREREKSHKEQIERWARYIRDNPDWKMKLKPFLDAQIIMARRAYLQILESENGREKVLKLKGLI